MHFAEDGLIDSTNNIKKARCAIQDVLKYSLSSFLCTVFVHRDDDGHDVFCVSRLSWRVQHYVV